MSDLADAALPLIRTRPEVYRGDAANAPGRQIHEAVNALDRAAATEEPNVILTVTQKAIASAMRDRPRGRLQRDHRRRLLLPARPAPSTTVF